MDILDATLKAGTSVQKFIPSYGDAPNDLKHVTKCMRCAVTHCRPHTYAHCTIDVKEKFSGFQVRSFGTLHIRDAKILTLFLLIETPVAATSTFPLLRDI